MNTFYCVVEKECCTLLISLLLIKEESNFSVSYISFSGILNYLPSYERLLYKYYNNLGMRQ